MKTKVLLLVALFAVSTAAKAQQTSDEATKNVTDGVLATADADAAEGWSKGGVLGLNMGQVALSNWQGGGQSSISGTSLLSLFRNYKQGKTAWDNSLDLAYGLLSQDNGPFIKSDDRIELDSKYGRQFKNNEKLYYGGLVNFRSQFAPGFATVAQTNLISRIMSPAYITAAIGIDYKPTSAFSLFFAPVSFRGTVVLDPALNALGAYGVTANESVRHEMGGLVMIKFQDDIMKNINLKSQATFFSNYLDRPENVDLLWDLLLTMKVNKYINASIGTTLIYDHDINIATDDNNDGVFDVSGPKMQFKEVLNIGFAYKF